MKRYRTLLLAGLTGANALLGVAYTWLIITRLGTGAVTDALFAAMVVPQLILVIMTSPLTGTLVPLLATTTDRGLFRRDAWTLSLGALFLFGGIAAVLGVLAPVYVPWTVPGFDERTTARTVALAQVQLIGLPFSGALPVLLAAAYARNRFVWAEISIFASALLGLLFLIPGLPRAGAVAAAGALTLRPILQALFLLPCLGRFSRPAWRGGVVRAAWQRLRPPLLGNAYYKLDLLLDRVLSSMAPAGSLSLLYLGQSLFSTGTDIAQRSLINPVLPRLAVHAAAGDEAAFRHICRSGAVRILAITGAAYLGLVLVGEELLGLLIGHGGVTRQNVHQLWLLMTLSGGVLVIAPLGGLMTSAFYARGATLAPTIAGVIAFTLGAPLKLALFWSAGVRGLALGISLYYLVALIVMIAMIAAARRRYPHASVVWNPQAP
jgi:putative peptidoglycan lipid II flippase